MNHFKALGNRNTLKRYRLLSRRHVQLYLGRDLCRSELVLPSDSDGTGRMVIIQ